MVRRPHRFESQDTRPGDWRPERAGQPDCVGIYWPGHPELAGELQQRDGARWLAGPRGTFDGGRSSERRRPPVWALANLRDPNPTDLPPPEPRFLPAHPYLSCAR